jgi:hypothetical protein
MTAATFGYQVGKALEFFEQQRNEKTACSAELASSVSSACAKLAIHTSGPGDAPQ